MKYYICEHCGNISEGVGCSGYVLWSEDDRDCTGNQ